MKIKTQPNETKSGNHFEQAVMKGLTKNGKQWAKEQIKKFEDSGLAPYGLIRKEALNIK